MVSRYSCSLQEDQQLLQQRDSLAPRLAAAVTARSGEKEVWAELQQVGEGGELGSSSKWGRNSNSNSRNVTASAASDCIGVQLVQKALWQRDVCQQTAMRQAA